MNWWEVTLSDVHDVIVTQVEQPVWKHLYGSAPIVHTSRLKVWDPVEDTLENRMESPMRMSVGDWLR